jgi:hypothetical protein
MFCVTFISGTKVPGSLAITADRCRSAQTPVLQSLHGAVVTLHSCAVSRRHPDMAVALEVKGTQYAQHHSTSRRFGTEHCGLLRMHAACLVPQPKCPNTSARRMYCQWLTPSYFFIFGRPGLSVSGACTVPASQLIVAVLMILIIILSPRPACAHRSKDCAHAESFAAWLRFRLLQISGVVRPNMHANIHR